MIFSKDLSSAPGKEELLALIQAGDGLLEEWLCWERSVALHCQLDVTQHWFLAVKVPASWVALAGTQPVDEGVTMPICSVFVGPSLELSSSYHSHIPTLTLQHGRF